MAQRGLDTLGVDRSGKVIRAARRRYEGLAGCRFQLMDLGPADIASLPESDVVLLLSVHHHWLMAYGPDVAGQMLQGIATRARRVLVFEGASRNIRYGNHPPGFIDNDEATVTAYLRGYLDRFVGDRFARIEALGKTPCVGEREPWRWAWALYK
jgi:hypothetical protein